MTKLNFKYRKEAVTHFVSTKLFPYCYFFLLSFSFTLKTKAYICNGETLHGFQKIIIWIVIVVWDINHSFCCTWLLSRLEGELAFNFCFWGDNGNIIWTRGNINRHNTDKQTENHQFTPHCASKNSTSY